MSSWCLVLNVGHKDLRCRGVPASYRESTCAETDMKRDEPSYLGKWHMFLPSEALAASISPSAICPFLSKI